MLLEKDQIDRVDSILSRAAAEGRRSLYEHEVYAMVDAVGIRTPRWIFSRDGSDLDAAALAPFGRQAMVKIVSADIPHKSKVGGVQAVRCDEPLYVRFVLQAMEREVLAHFPEGRTPRLDGFLIVEFVAFTLALGNEILIGVKEDPAFGPVLTLSKGGEDAEFFSRYYDPPNLMPVPVSRERAAELTSAIKIRRRYEEAGHGDYCGLIADALAKVSRLAYQYSFLASRRPPFYLTALDLNPLVFSSDGRFLAVDGFATFALESEHGVRPPRPDASGLRGFFEPEGIAVAGVSSDPAKYSMARIIVQLLADLGRDDVYCVNPKGGSAEIGGRAYRLYEGLDGLPAKPGLVVFAAPAARLLDFLGTVPDRTPVILISGVPPDTPFEDYERGLARHRGRGIRFIGPNCMGVYFSPGGGKPGVDTLFIGEDRLRVTSTERSNCALFTQSGAMAITAVERSQNAPIFRAIVSFGNKADVNVPDLIRYFSLVPSIEVMAMYLEGLGPGEGREFLDEASRSDKPIIVFRSGRTAEGARAAASHTAAMSGDYEVFAAACARARAVLVDELPDFYNAMKAFSMLAGRAPSGNRVAGVVNAGLDATMGADLLGYLRQAAFSEETLGRLRAVNRHGLANVGAALLDVTPMTDDAMFGEFVEAVLDDPGVDCALVAIVPHVENLKAEDGRCRDADSVASRLIRIAGASDKPIVVSINSGNHFLDLVRYLEEGGLPVFPDIRQAVRALDAFARYHVEKAGRGRGVA